MKRTNPGLQPVGEIGPGLMILDQKHRRRGRSVKLRLSRRRRKDRFVLS